MKKKLLLIALPALMALSGCANIQKEQPKAEEQPAFAFEEDTTACEDIFGEAIEAKQPAIKKMDVVDTKSAYKIGYQIHFDNKSDADASNDVISIRFIAAINDEYSSMVWSRGVATKNGGETKAFGDKRSDGTTPLASTVVYSSLSNGGEDLMKAGQGAYADYAEGFIVYSIRNIPYEANKDSYIGVSLLLDAVQTDFYAVKIEKNGAGTGSANAFKIENGKEGFLLAGIIDGQVRVVSADGTPKDSKVASFVSYFDTSDSFVVTQKTSEMFKIWDGSCLTDGDSDVDEDNGKVLIATPSRYTFYLNDANGVSHKIYNTYSETYGVNYYLRGPATTGSWDSLTNDDFRLFEDPDNQGFLRVHIGSGQFKLTHRSDWDDAKGWGNRVDDSPTGAIADGDIIGSDNFECVTPGIYDVYLTNSWKVHFVLILAD